jgi:hypothetical protein
MVVVERSSLSRALRRFATADKFVNNRVVNCLGAQPGRALVAATLVAWRRRRAPDGGAIGRQLERDGVVLIPDYLDPAIFEELQREAEEGFAALAKAAPAPDKFGLVRQQISLLKYPDRFPLAHQTLLQNQDLLSVIRYYEGWDVNATFADRGALLKFERLEQVVNPDALLPERDEENSSGDMHSDTFHRVTKAFLTVSPMTHENSPYTYCIGTQRVTWRRLLWEYRNSIRADQYGGDDEFRRRLFSHEIERMGLRPVPLTAFPNTLILTDTSGFHLRGTMTRKGAVRKMLRMDFRSDPFRG